MLNATDFHHHGDTMHASSFCTAAALRIKRSSSKLRTQPEKSESKNSTSQMGTSSIRKTPRQQCQIQHKEVKTFYFISAVFWFSRIHADKFKPSDHEIMICTLCIYTASTLSTKDQWFLSLTLQCTSTHSWTQLAITSQVVKQAVLYCWCKNLKLSGVSELSASCCQNSKHTDSQNHR